jgi:Tol biopolymer transport system component
VGRPSCCADIDGSGNFVVFHSSADDLVAGDGGGDDIFLYDVSSGVTTRVSDGIIAMGLQQPTSPTIAPGGDYIAFAARNFVGQPVIVRYERATGELLALHPTLPVATADVGRIAISDDGSDIVFETAATLLDGDDNGSYGTDVYRWSLTPGTIAFQMTTTAAREGTTAALALTRTGGSDGRVVAYVTSEPITATAGSDYVALPPAGLPVTWEDGDTATKPIPIITLPDGLLESDETLRVRVVRVDGGSLGTASKATVVIRDP